MNGEENKRRDEIWTAKWFIGDVIPPNIPHGIHVARFCSFFARFAPYSCFGHRVVRACGTEVVRADEGACRRARGSASWMGSAWGGAPSALGKRGRSGERRGGRRGGWRGERGWRGARRGKRGRGPAPGGRLREDEAARTKTAAAGYRELVGHRWCGMVFRWLVGP